ncbi:dihydrofolate reductase family protein [Streptomyces albipurpureus]|uniref:Dihydrofolate reductase family protein n=1 Tax=Streptomyces albipurpureus TaxID=2897419 RepID=A0ABT0UIX2_9ACTN|nr:dihydrofolate reductase family protein [Streptomyces sp. CWNU-1]MCM2388040.1 dihydrofolate reductase family protein [Streptomyces sp. CWNU-1]
MRKLSYYVAASIDGFIGAPDGDAEFLNRFVVGDLLDYLRTEQADTLSTMARQYFGVDDQPLSQYDTVIQGRASYDIALREGNTRPYAHLRELVASRTLTESPDPEVEIVSGDVVGRVRELKKEDGLAIYLCGGANLAGQLRDEVDELVIKTYPVILGDGMRMFDTGFRMDEFTLISMRSFDNGVIVRKYART